MKRIFPVVWLVLGLMVLLAACTMPVSESGPPPRPTVIVVTAEGPYYTGFDDPGDWLVGDTDNSSGRIVDGVYYMTVKQPETLAWTHGKRTFGSGIYELDARFISGPESSAYGLMLLATSDLSSFVYVLITDDGRYDIGLCANWCQGQESLIGGFTLSYAIVPGEESNHLRLELIDGTLNLSINGAPVSQVMGITASEGLVGFIGESAQYGGFETTFDNLQVVESSIAPAGPTPIPIPATAIPAATSPPLIEPTLSP